MEATQSHPDRRDLCRATMAALGTVLIALVAIQTFKVTTQQPTPPGPLREIACCEESASSDHVPGPTVVSSPAEQRRLAPDLTGDEIGGIAARVHIADGTPVPGNLFVLMATKGSDATARLYDQTAYTHDNGIAPDTHESNLVAATTVETITAIDVDLLEFTNASGGGPSAGITYTIAYLNVISDGAFTGDLRVAATGRIGTHGYVDPINAIDHKTAASHLADADVLFTPSTPTDGQLETYAARHVGERFRAHHTGNPLADERRLDHYHEWGATRPDGMDVIHVRHIADVAAYLCGTGSTYACHITALLEDTTTEFTREPVDPTPSHDRVPVGVR